MMAIDFPASPANGATHTAAGAVWVYDGVKWKANSASAPGDITSVVAGTGLSGGGTSGDVSLALSVPVSIANGGTGSTTAAAAPWVEVGGDTMTGDLIISKATPVLALKKAASGQVNAIDGYTGANTRWRMHLGDATSEAGSNVGSDFILSRYTDAGAIIGNPLFIPRSSGRFVVTNDAGSSSSSMLVQSATSGVTATITLLANGSRQWTMGPNVASSGRFTLTDDTAAAQRIIIQTNGDCFNQTGTWNALSDQRAKRDIEPYTRGLADFVQLQPVSFNYNGTLGSQDDGRRHVGLVAQEVLPHVPEVVGVIEAPDSEQAAMTIDPGMLIYGVINSIKELDATIKELGDRLAALEARLPA